MTVVADALRQAADHGAIFTLEGGRVRCRHGEALPADLFRTLYERLAELREILAGHRCRHCGEPIDWRQPGAVAFADGRAAHLVCYERVEAERQARRHERPRPDPTERAA
jgi:hypothetical protein